MCQGETYADASIIPAKKNRRHRCLRLELRILASKEALRSIEHTGGSEQLTAVPFHLPSLPHVLTRSPVTATCDGSAQRNVHCTGKDSLKAARKKEVQSTRHMQQVHSRR